MRMDGTPSDTVRKSVVGATSTASEPLLTELAIPIPPQVEGRSCNPKASAGLVDVPDALGVLKDSLLSMNLSLVVRHSDLLGHHLL
jgi:hypothetical protein